MEKEDEKKQERATGCALLTKPLPLCIPPPTHTSRCSLACARSLACSLARLQARLHACVRECVHAQVEVVGSDPFRRRQQMKKVKNFGGKSQFTHTHARTHAGRTHARTHAARLAPQNLSKAKQVGGQGGGSHASLVGDKVYISLEQLGFLCTNTERGRKKKRRLCSRTY